MGISAEHLSKIKKNLESLKEQEHQKAIEQNASETEKYLKLLSELKAKSPESFSSYSDENKNKENFQKALLSTRENILYKKLGGFLGSLDKCENEKEYQEKLNRLKKNITDLEEEIKSRQAAQKVISKHEQLMQINDKIEKKLTERIALKESDANTEVAKQSISDYQKLVEEQEKTSKELVQLIQEEKENDYLKDKEVVSDIIKQQEEQKKQKEEREKKETLSSIKENPKLLNAEFKTLEKIKEDLEGYISSEKDILEKISIVEIIRNSDPINYISKVGPPVEYKNVNEIAKQIVKDNEGKDPEKVKAVCNSVFGKDVIGNLNDNLDRLSGKYSNDLRVVRGTAKSKVHEQKIEQLKSKRASINQSIHEALDGVMDVLISKAGIKGAKGVANIRGMDEKIKKTFSKKIKEFAEECHKDKSKKYLYEKMKQLFKESLSEHGFEIKDSDFAKLNKQIGMEKLFPNICASMFQNETWQLQVTESDKEVKKIKKEMQSIESFKKDFNDFAEGNPKKSDFEKLSKKYILLESSFDEAEKKVISESLRECEFKVDQRFKTKAEKSIDSFRRQFETCMVTQPNDEQLERLKEEYEVSKDNFNEKEQGFFKGKIELFEYEKEIRDIEKENQDIKERYPETYESNETWKKNKSEIAGLKESIEKTNTKRYNDIIESINKIQPKLESVKNFDVELARGMNGELNSEELKKLREDFNSFSENLDVTDRAFLSSKIDSLDTQLKCRKLIQAAEKNKADIEKQDPKGFKNDENWQKNEKAIQELKQKIKEKDNGGYDVILSSKSQEKSKEIISLNRQLKTCIKEPNEENLKELRKSYDLKKDSLDETEKLFYSQKLKNLEAESKYKKSMRPKSYAELKSAHKAKLREELKPKESKREELREQKTNKDINVEASTLLDSIDKTFAPNPEINEVNTEINELNQRITKVDSKYPDLHSKKANDIFSNKVESLSQKMSERFESLNNVNNRQMQDFENFADDMISELKTKMGELERQLKEVQFKGEALGMVESLTKSEFMAALIKLMHFMQKMKLQKPLRELEETHSRLMEVKGQIKQKANEDAEEMVNKGSGLEAQSVDPKSANDPAKPELPDPNDPRRFISAKI